MSIAVGMPSPRAAPAHALKNCLAVVRAVNRLLESDVSERSRERLARSQDGLQVWAVRDTGHGIPEEVRQRLGMPFVTSKNRGSGVGFALARKIVEQHGGQLHVRTIEGSGTVVSMRLPAPAQDASAEELSRAR
ncbi:MAG TPA: ATP-binding protein [Polyangiaceae bacterium]|nr:ATP-binding protein [Polyangiaceae bacterium]